VNQATHPLYNQVWCLAVPLDCGHKYYFSFTLANYSQVLSLVGKSAANPGEPLTWKQASSICDRIREIVCSAQQALSKTQVASQLQSHQTSKTQDAAMATYNIRWMIRRDMQEVLAIEEASFPNPWLESDFLQCMRRRQSIGMVVEYGQQVVGYIVYELHKRQIDVINIAVHPAWRRKGIASAMLQRIQVNMRACVSVSTRHSVEVIVRETNLAAQLFFKRCGLRGVRVLRDWYEGRGFDCQEDAYLMRWHVSQEPVGLELAGKE